MNRVLIGVAGGSGSGKTTVAARLKKEFQESVRLVCHDWYYLPHDDMTYEERSHINYDHPNAFDGGLFLEQLQALKEGREILHPVYDYTVHNRAPERVPMDSAKVIIVDGILIFNDPEVRKLLDIKVFVDTDADVRVLRRIMRDVKERERSLDSVVSQYLETIKPMHEQFVEPSKRYADLIIPRGGHNEVAMGMLIQQIRALLQA